MDECYLSESDTRGLLKVKLLYVFFFNCLSIPYISFCSSARFVLYQYTDQLVGQKVKPKFKFCFVKQVAYPADNRHFKVWFPFIAGIVSSYAPDQSPSKSGVVSKHTETLYWRVTQTLWMSKTGIMKQVQLFLDCCRLVSDKNEVNIDMETYFSTVANV